MTEWLHALRLRLRAARERRRLERDLEDELAFHLAMKEEQAHAAGADADEARCAARRRLGNPTALKESLREAWTLPAIESVWQDVRHAARGLAKARGFTAVAVLSLAVGIGANTSIFTVFHALFLRSLPVRDPQELRIVNWTGHAKAMGKLIRSNSGYGSGDGVMNTRSSFSFEAFEEMARQPVFSSFAGFAPISANVVARSQAHRAPAQLVTGRYFETVGTHAALGRTLTMSDDSPGAPPAAVISWRLYQRLFAGDVSALGDEIRIDRTPYTVVGILPVSFHGLSSASPVDLYVPMARAGELSPYELHDKTYWWVQVVGRVAPGVTDSQVKAGLDVALNGIAAAHDVSDAPKAVLIDARTGLAFLYKDVQGFLLVLLAMVAIVLLTACANLANLLLARGSARSRELAIRRALGAGGLRIARYLLTESLLLALIGGALGLLLAYAGTGLLTPMVFPDPETVPAIRPDATTLLFTGTLSLLTAMLFGMFPAIRAARVHPGACLKQTGADAGVLRQRFARGLVVVQVAAAAVLVVGAGLFARTIINLGRVELGFRPDHLLMFYVDPGNSGYKDQRLADVYRRIRDNVAAIPGVQAVTATRMALLSGWMSNTSITIPGHQSKSREYAYMHVVGERFLTVMGTPILLGRDLQPSDDANAPRVAVINSAMAKKWFEGSPVGREFSTLGKSIRIVGVAADSKYDKIRSNVEPTVYLPWMQNLESASGMFFQLRTSVEPLSVAAAARRAVAAIDPTLPVADVRTQQQLIERATARERTFAMLGSFFSAVALLLACIGIYGVLAYAVARRTGEFGIRLALGASRGQIRWLVIRGTVALIVCATAIGIPMAFACVKLIKSRLFGVEPADPLTLAVAGAAIVVAALIAAWIPSERAARSDPATSLRYE